MVRNERVILTRNGAPCGSRVSAHEDVVGTHVRDAHKDSTGAIRCIRVRVESHPCNTRDVRVVTRRISWIRRIRANRREIRNLAPVLARIG